MLLFIELFVDVTIHRTPTMLLLLDSFKPVLIMDPATYRLHHQHSDCAKSCAKPLVVGSQYQ